MALRFESRMRRPVLCALIAALGLLVPAAGADDAAVRGVIDRAWVDHIAAAQRKDLDAVLAIYADDVVYVTPDMRSIRGKPAVREMEAATLASATVVEAVHSIHGLQVQGAVAYELGTVEGSIRTGGTEPVDVVYHFMAMWIRDDYGRWHIRYLVGQPAGEVEPDDPAKAGIGESDP